MSRQVHFLDPYKFQIEEMVKLGCTDEHIRKVLHDIQIVEFTRDDLIRYMDKTGIRKRRAEKRWTRSKEIEWEKLRISSEIQCIQRRAEEARERSGE